MSGAGERGATWFETPEALDGAARRRVVPVPVVLDVGPGIRPMTFFEPSVYVCIEPYDEYVRVLQNRFAGDPRPVILRGGAREALEMLPERSVDSVFLLDVIEHLTKEEGRAVLGECERVARRQIVLFTPLGFMPQEYERGDVDAWGLGGSDVQQHRSGWDFDDFGAGWEFLACRRYHVVDAKGERLDPGFGAFWAFRTIPPDGLRLRDRTLFVGRDLSPLPPAEGPLAVLFDWLGGLRQEDFGMLCAAGPDLAPFGPYPQAHTRRLGCASAKLSAWADAGPADAPWAVRARRHARGLLTLARMTWKTRAHVRRHGYRAVVAVATDTTAVWLGWLTSLVCGARLTVLAFEAAPEAERLARRIAARGGATVVTLPRDGDAASALDALARRLGARPGDGNGAPA